MSTPLLLRGVDLAAFAAALAARLRSAGVSVSASGQGGFVQALQHLAPQTTVALYWAARLTLVNRMDDLGAFDAVLREVFGSVQPGDTRSPESVLPIAGPKTPAAPVAGIVQPAASQSANARAENCRGSPGPRPTGTAERTRASSCQTCCPAASPRWPTNRSTNSTPKIFA